MLPVMLPVTPPGCKERGVDQAEAEADRVLDEDVVLDNAAAAHLKTVARRVGDDVAANDGVVVGHRHVDAVIEDRGVAAVGGASAGAVDDGFLDERAVGLVEVHALAVAGAGGVCIENQAAANGQVADDAVVALDDDIGPEFLNLHILDVEVRAGAEAVNAAGRRPGR